MRKVVVVNNITLDGVMQAPARPDEDTRGGFAHGGWVVPYNDTVKGEQMAAGTSGGFDLLFGRRTYQDFFTVWPSRTDSPFSAALTRARKYVASTSLKAPLPWQNSVLLEGDAADAVAALKRDSGNDLTILGSGGLIRSLLVRGLIDVMVLCFHPLVLGSGLRLFPEAGGQAKFRLLESVPTTTGVIIATYQLA
jgi:dihydrofolate reductase